MPAPQKRSPSAAQAVRTQLGGLSEAERQRMLEDLEARQAEKNKPVWSPLPGPQTRAIESEADICFVGGSAGGGKSDLLLGLSIIHHHRSIIFRREYQQLKGLRDRAVELLSGLGSYNGALDIWRLNNGKVIEFGAVQKNDDVTKFQGRAHDNKCFDEVTHFCCSPETEVLTSLGWRLIGDVEVGQTVASLTLDRQIVFSRVTATPSFDFDGSLVSVAQRNGVSFRVTPNHRVAIDRQDPGESLGYVTAEHLAATHQSIPRTGLWDEHPDQDWVYFDAPSGRGIGVNANVTDRISCDDYLEFMGWYLSEGSAFLAGASHGGTTPCVSIRQTKPAPTLDALMLRMPWKVRSDGDGGYRIFSRQLFDHLKPLGNAHQKRIPRWILDLCRRQQKILLSSFLLGDGKLEHRTKRGAAWQICLCNEGLIDDLQEMAFRCGLISTKGYMLSQGKYHVHRLSISFEGRGRTMVKPKDVKREPYVGKVHCLTVPDTGNFLIRHNGRISWTGNSEAQFRFLIGWARTTIPGQRVRVVATGNPPTDATGDWVISYWAPWLDPVHPNPAADGELRWFASIDGKDVERPDGEPFEMPNERTGATELVRPISRTFIRSWIQDNPYLLKSNYLATLQALPEPLRSKLLLGDFSYGREDDSSQVIPTAWVLSAQSRWTEERPGWVDVIGVDVARGGDDKTVLSVRSGSWMAHQKVIPGTGTPDAPAAMKHIFGAIPPGHAPKVQIDVIGVGSSVYDLARLHGLDAYAMNSSKASFRRDRSGQLGFANKRAEWWWTMREMLDPASPDEPIALPPDRELMADLTAPRWRITLRGIQIELKDEIRMRIGRSTDKGDSCVYCFAVPAPPPHVRLI